MAADGSGNGFNYEDGTFAPDELITRRCIAKGEVCELKDEKVWKLALSDNRMLFQTTIQRWFADPILSATGTGLSTVGPHNEDGVHATTTSAPRRSSSTVSTPPS